jgi:hypothetical protein
MGIGKILNHADPRIASVYDRHSYDGEKRAALDAWAARLEEIIGDRQDPPSIAPLRASA